ncbi:hypothetical protein EDD37DRAFT_626930 [Exophiala viscosa]|uniref:DUF1754-domain-containing protein n=1 Tax=Exophiala viscosa TaxID=2486360 RepID=A0AAN6DV93_9EURO|nr:hypothetical protein EDD36DRAFT_496425 [Exophiala viscosa]KAI1626316.1 hypothetical protein EDD37DRAFT_626930 [Exophiala viscosa]
MTPSDYASAGSGKLKLKGVKDSKVDKKKKKKSSSKSKDEDGTGDGGETFQDRSVMLKNLEDEDAQLAKEQTSKSSLSNGKEFESATGLADEEEREIVKTEAERKYDEQRRKRLEERLKREGVKTHKERVEELNRYLSGLSEHHDMPRIGPG